MITLEDLGLFPASKPLALVFSGSLSYRGYWKDTAVCRLDFYSGGGRRVFIATEVPENQGLSITNGIERVAAAIEEKFVLPHVFGPGSDGSSVLIEHYTPDSYEGRQGDEDFSVMRFKHESKGGFPSYGDPDWFRVEKSEIERLIGGHLAG